MISNVRFTLLTILEKSRALSNVKSGVLEKQSFGSVA